MFKKDTKQFYRHLRAKSSVTGSHYGQKSSTTFYEGTIDEKRRKRKSEEYELGAHKNNGNHFIFVTNL
jgi:hypothetical protein